MAVANIFEISGGVAMAKLKSLYVKQRLRTRFMVLWSVQNQQQVYLFCFFLLHRHFNKWDFVHMQYCYKYISLNRGYIFNKQITFCRVCAGIDHRWRHSVQRTKKDDTRRSRVTWLLSFTHCDVFCDLLQTPGKI